MKKSQNEEIAAEVAQVLADREANAARARERAEKTQVVGAADYLGAMRRAWVESGIMPPAPNAALVDHARICGSGRDGRNVPRTGNAAGAQARARRGQIEPSRPMINAVLTPLAQSDQPAIGLAPMPGSRFRLAMHARTKGGYSSLTSPARVENSTAATRIITFCAWRDVSKGGGYWRKAPSPLSTAIGAFIEPIRHSANTQISNSGA